MSADNSGYRSKTVILSLWSPGHYQVVGCCVIDLVLTAVYRIQTIKSIYHYDIPQLICSEKKVETTDLSDHQLAKKKNDF